MLAEFQIVFAFLDIAATVTRIVCMSSYSGKTKIYLFGFIWIIRKHIEKKMQRYNKFEEAYKRKLNKYL